MRAVALPNWFRLPEFASDELVTDPGISPLTRSTILVAGLCVTAAIAWAVLTPVHEVATSFGEIVPSRSVQVAQHLEGGTVAEILVKQGQLVEAGQPLVRFEGATTRSSRDQYTARRIALQAQMERLQAFAEDRPADFAPYASQPDVVDNNRQLLAAQIEAKRNQRAVLVNQGQQAAALLTASKLQLASVMTDLDIAEHKVQLRKDLVEKGLNSKLNLLEAQRDLASAQSEKARLEGVIASTQHSLGENRSRLSELDGRLRQEALDKLETTGAQLAELNKLIEGQEDRVDHLVTVAPVRGIVMELPVKTIGGVVAPGGIVARLVPVDDELMAEVRVSTRDIGFVRPGQPVKVKVQAFDYARYGRIDGTLDTVSPTTFMDEQKNPYYLARVKLAASYVGHDRERYQVVPGMTVQADITTGEKTVFQYLLKPIYTTVDSAFHER
ncbi:HlyD family type I secretion periplasmic adaptor subunit [Azospirillum sp. B4]|uniref:HlyD family type I secretion periplasmic adaptor subunit n=1 Tax=Azospirillum sp. B4 TaxID=95605 RepID=UPI000345D8D7|nr:HlyD family type I secretion periplasmic adaptor subunit [Azospirillum sp. B4]